MRTNRSDNKTKSKELGKQRFFMYGLFAPEHSLIEKFQGIMHLQYCHCINGSRKIMIKEE